MVENIYLNDYNSYIESHKIAKNDAIKMNANRHHVIPLCIGGLDAESNIVYLLPKDHAKAHELLYKAYHACAVQLAHTIVSMVGKKNCDTTTLNDDKLNEFNLKMSDAYHLAKDNCYVEKRTVYNIADLSSRKIFKDTKLPHGCVESPSCRNAMIFNKDFAKKMWDKDNIPDGWRLVSAASDAEKSKLFKTRDNGMKGSRWIHSIQTSENRMLKANEEIPNGWSLGKLDTDAAKERCKAGGMKAKARLDKIKEEYGGFRWVYCLATHKNMLVGKTQQLPAGYAEGMFDKRIELLQKQLIEKG